MLMRPEVAFPYVFAAEGAQHPLIKPPRSTSRHAQRPAALNVLPRSTSCRAQRSATLNVLPPRLLQAKLFFFAATKLESDAEVVVA